MDQLLLKGFYTSARKELKVEFKLPDLMNKGENLITEVDSEGDAFEANVTEPSISQ